MRKPAVVAIVTLALSPLARAEEAASPGPFTRSVRATASGSLNPLGVQGGLEAAWTRPLFSSRHPLLADAHVAFGAGGRATPAYARGGAWVELAPLSVFELRAGLEPVGYFGTFHSLLPFTSYRDPFDDETRNARAGSRRGAALRAYASPTVKARLGRLMLRSRADVEWWRAHAPGSYFYEPYRDTLLQASGDTLLAGESVALWAVRNEGSRKLLLGAVHDFTRVAGAPRRNRRQDAGLLAVWGLGPRRLGLGEPVVFAKVVRYLDDPNREGQLAAQVALGFSVGKR
ncbi:MAG TPA: hypothetical protein VF310_11940 [Vicinamibacteria bacterium]